MLLILDQFSSVSPSRRIGLGPWRSMCSPLPLAHRRILTFWPEHFVVILVHIQQEYGLEASLITDWSLGTGQYS